MRSLATAALLAAGCWACVPEPTQPPPLLADGEPCTGDEGCKSSECIPFLGGARCGRRCEGNAGCDPKGTCRLAEVQSATIAQPTIDRVCRSVSATTAPGGASCGQDGDCRSGLCVEGLCLDLCADDCGPKRQCEAQPLTRFGCSFSTQLCAVRLARADLDLGPVEATAAGSAELSFQVPEGTGSITWVLDDPDGLRVAMRSLVAPDGTVLIDGDAATPDLNPGSHYIGTASVMVPSTDRNEARGQAGLWRFNVGTYDPLIFDQLVPVPGRIEHLPVIFKGESSGGGRLDLLLSFAPATGVTEATSTTSRPIKALVAGLERRLLTPAGLELGEVRLRGLPIEHDRVEDGAETRRICQTRSALGPRGISVNVFVVQELTYTRGHAGGIPGPPGLVGTRASGIVLQHLGSWDDTAILMAHEVGHFLGLRHTSELSGGGNDPISDTPECPSGTEVSACPDYHNLMFPAFPLNEALELTPGQISVLRRSPWLYEVP